MNPRPVWFSQYSNFIKKTFLVLFSARMTSVARWCVLYLFFSLPSKATTVCLERFTTALVHYHFSNSYVRLLNSTAPKYSITAYDSVRNFALFCDALWASSIESINYLLRRGSVCSSFFLLKVKAIEAPNHLFRLITVAHSRDNYTTRCIPFIMRPSYKNVCFRAAKNRIWRGSRNFGGTI